MFCRVIDNFGDAGIAWRLAQSLRTEKNWRVRLIIDDAATLSAMVPEVDASLVEQTVSGIRIRRWDKDFEATCGTPEAVADIVIELFSCFLPEAYEGAINAALASRRVAVAALDYLTAEQYAEDSNGLASPHPRYGYQKTFLFPGFTAKTCGVIYEANLERRQDAFMASGRSREVLARLGADPAAPFTLFFFTYPEMPVAVFAREVAADPRPLQILAAPGRATEMLAAELDRLAPAHVKLVRAPMVPQADFDEVLMSATACLVRGEDSTMRAQLAGRPLIWTLYPQKDNIQLDKLAAFAGLYCGALRKAGDESPDAQEAAAAWLAFEERINRSDSETLGWSAWRDHFEMLEKGASLWRKTLFSQSSLTERIAQTLEKKLK